METAGMSTIRGRRVEINRMSRCDAQRRRTMSRCQRRMLSGVTSSRSPWRRALGITPSRVANSALVVASKYSLTYICIRVMEGR